MLIPLLTATNLACLDRLVPEVFDNVIDPVQLERFIGDRRHIMLMAVVDGLVVGMASAVEYFYPDKPPQLWINEVGVSPALQRRGIGRALTAAPVEVGRNRGLCLAGDGEGQRGGMLPYLLACRVFHRVHDSVVVDTRIAWLLNRLKMGWLDAH